jgi:sulfatase modifying factor 1
VPVYATIGFDLEVKVSAQADAALGFRAGVRTAMQAEFGIRYLADSNPALSPIHSFTVQPPTLIAPDGVTFDGNLKLKLILQPSVSFLVYGQAGAKLALKLEGGLGLKKDLTGAGRTEGRFNAAASLVLTPDGPALSWIDPKPSFTLDFWSRSWHLFPREPLTILEPPQGVALYTGENFMLSMEVNRLPEEVAFQWHKDGVPLSPGTQFRAFPRLFDGPELLYENTAGQFRRFNATLLDSGVYRVVARSGKESVEATANVQVTHRPTRLIELVGDLAFGYLEPGQSESRNLVIRNRGNAPLTVSGISHPYPAAFFGDWSGEIPPGGLRSVVVTFAPTAEAAYSGEITVGSDATGGRSSHPISGSSHPDFAEVTRIIALSGDLQFGSVTPGSSATRTLTITNLGNSPLTVGGLSLSNAAFSAAGSGTIEPGSSMAVAVTFTPAAAQSYGGQIVVHSNATDGHARIGVSGAGSTPAPAGFSLIPAGTYARGDHKNESESYMASSRPVHNVHVSAFYMARTPVTFAEWKEVYDWAVAHGYTFDNAGQRGSNSSGGALPDTPENNQHPVMRVNWYDVVKWSNAKSEREGLTPVYYINDARTTVYRQGRHDVTIAQVNWSANGYRLPTEAEWEKAARGGLVGARWPWGDAEIDGTRANYWNSGGTNGTTPVGSYAANGYDLYDMAGNVWEWNWDWFSDTWYSQPGASEADTRGPVSGSYRVGRGGSWLHYPVGCRVALRHWSWPDRQWNVSGFRLARTQ